MHRLVQDPSTGLRLGSEKLEGNLRQTKGCFSIPIWLMIVCTIDLSFHFPTLAHYYRPVLTSSIPPSPTALSPKPQRLLLQTLLRQ